MSNEAPERYYKLKGHSELMPENLLESYDKIEASYIRDDLFGQHCKLRRREMFEKYCLSSLANSSISPIQDWDWKYVNEHVELLILKADKFARGEE